MLVKIAKIVKAQGIKGEVKLLCLLDDASQFLTFTQLYLENQPCAVQSARVCSPDCCVAKLDCSSTRTDAENIVGKSLFVQREQLHLATGHYLIDELIGCMVILDDGKRIGKVTALSPCSSADILHCTGPRNVSFPFLKDLVIEVNVEEQSLLLSASRFAEVCLYED